VDILPNELDFIALRHSTHYLSTVMKDAQLYKSIQQPKMKLVAKAQREKYKKNCVDGKKDTVALRTRYLSKLERNR
jgi:hypothetical protein